jgi:hypothetical protein
MKHHRAVAGMKASSGPGTAASSVTGVGEPHVNKVNVLVNNPRGGRAILAAGYGETAGPGGR